MKLPSFKKLIKQTGIAIKRFPLVSVFAIIGTCITIYMIEADLTSATEKELFKILQTLSLGALFMLAAILRFETITKARWMLYLVQAIGVGLMLFYYYFIPEMILGSTMAIYAALFVGLGFAVLCAPFVRTGLSLAFWQFVKALILRAFFAFIFLGVLYAGVSIALASIDFLFGVEVPGERYIQIYAFIVGILGVHFVLAGIPEKTTELEKITNYPKGLKLFAQYIVIPLVAIYFLILYSYSAKVLITGIWPEGFLAYMIICFAGAGIAAALLLYPLQKTAEQPWIKWFSRIFYIAVLPMTGMLFWAIWIRIAEYGITEKRYYVIVLGVWLIGISLYYIFSKNKNIILVASSLSLIAVLSAIGPWSATNISEASQVNRLANILERNGLWLDGQLTLAEVIMASRDETEAEEILYYLERTHGFSALYSWSDQINENMENETLGNLLSVDFSGGAFFDREYNNSFFASTAKGRETLDIADYAYSTSIGVYQDERGPEIDYQIGNHLYAITLNSSRNGIDLLVDGEFTRSIIIESVLAEIIANKESNDNFIELSQDKLVIEATDDYGKMKLYFDYIDFNTTNAGITIGDFDGQLLTQPLPVTEASLE